MAPAHPLPTCASAKEVAAAEAAEEVAWKGLLAPEAASPASKSSTPRKRRRKDVEQVQKQEKREQDNLIGKLCKCGLVDEDKFMLQCDGCDVWFHGACVGVTQAQADRAKSWCCWRCAKKRNAASARTQRYCHCRGPWDGHAFMIACDSCDVWYHGACVGLRADSLQQGVEAAFRRYVCPNCTEKQRVASGGTSELRSSSSSSSPATPRAGLHACALMAASGVVASSPRQLAAQKSAAASVAVLSRALVGGAAPSSLVPRALLKGGGGGGGEGGGESADDRSAGKGLGEGRSSAGPSACGRDAPGLCLLFSMLSDDCLSLIIAHLPLASVLLTVSPTCRRLATVAEPHFQETCVRHGWRPLRRARDHPSAWRHVLLKRACAVCLGKDAHFPVRRGAGGSSGTTPMFRLCQTCARRDKVQQQVQRHGYEVDAIGEHGKALFARQFHMPLFGHANGFSTSLQAQVNTTGL